VRVRRASGARHGRMAGWVPPTTARPKDCP
jgi:hypothetical protein